MPTLPPPGVDPVDYIDITRRAYDALGYAPYRWAENLDPVDLVTPTKPLEECTVVLLASGGVYQVGDVGFTHKDDLTHREIPVDTPADQIRVTHFAYDTTNAELDPNVVFPLPALRALAEAGEIGAIAPVALTFMGGTYSQRRLGEQLTPVLVERVKELGADIALLVPV
jgi:D-proline reductase (dithiol) PrdB